VEPDVEAVLVHDVARAFVPPEVITRVIGGLALVGARAAIPIVPVTDTIRRSDPSTGDLHETVDRSTLSAVQTPQGFWRDALVDAHANALPDATDDASLIEARGGRVVAVRGDQRAFKITYPLDLILAEAVAHE
jgi:2-C-methyl-D-erythritol 4-phosphate cytidylyltransferase